MTRTTGLPLFECSEHRTRMGQRVWKFWCPFCRTEHTHGAEPGGAPRGSHRVAHCDHKSPLKKRGYMIRRMTKRTRQRLADSGLVPVDSQQSSTLPAVLDRIEVR